MKRESLRPISLAVGLVIATGVAFALGNEMHNKPFKISHVSDFYFRFSYYGPLISLALAAAASWLVHVRLSYFLLTSLPTLLFPGVLWIVYQAAFFIFEGEVGYDPGDLSPLTAEIALAYALMRWGTLGVCIGIVTAAVAFCLDRFLTVKDRRLE